MILVKYSRKGKIRKALSNASSNPLRENREISKQRKVCFGWKRFFEKRKTNAICMSSQKQPCVGWFWKLRNIHGKTLVLIKACNFNKKRLQHGWFSEDTTKFFKNNSSGSFVLVLDVYAFLYFIANFNHLADQSFSSFSKRTDSNKVFLAFFNYFALQMFCILLLHTFLLITILKIKKKLFHVIKI